MKKKLLCCALLAGVGLSQTAAAQSYDDRWYLTAGGGVEIHDEDRETNDDFYGVIGLGKRISPNWAIDAELRHSNADLISGGDRNWELMSLSVMARYHFFGDDRNWDPYVVLGLGAQEHHDGTQRSAVINGFDNRTGVDVVATLGLGFQWDIGYPYLRTEIGVRYDADDSGDCYLLSCEGDGGYMDAYLGFQFLFPIGPEAVAAPEVVPVVVQKTCADLDDDGDGVNNCDDKCPGSQAGQAIGPDGCPVPEPVMEPKPYRG